MGSTTRPWIALVLAAALLLTACGGGTVTESVGAAAGENSANEHLVGAYPTLAGFDIDLTTLQGQDVVLWFWAPW